MELILLPSIVAISSKLAFFILSRNVIPKVDKSLLAFLVGLCGVNVFELALMLSLPHPESAFFFLIMYYNSALLTAGFFLYYIIKLRGLESKIYGYTITAVCILAVFCTSIPSVALNGVHSIGYSITRIPGPFYPVLQVSLLVGILLAFVNLLYARKSEDATVKQKATILLVAVLPLIISVVFIIIAMQWGLHLNATIVVSIETSFMMGVLLYAESKHRLFKFLALIPSTEENKRWSRISEIIHNPELTLKEAQIQFTELFVQDALKRAQGNQIKAAKLLGTSRSTVYRYLSGKEEE